MSLKAPYNFVPISDQVVTAENLGLPAGLPSQIDPGTGGLCGELQVTLKAESPILVADSGTGEKGRRKRFFETPNGRAINGSTLRGVTRSVIEIASFARMWRVENRRFGMRDLNNSARLDYGDRMSANHGNDTYEAKARGGWLTETSEGLFLEEVAYGRIEHRDLSADFAKKAKALGRSKKVEEKTAMALEKRFKGKKQVKAWIEKLPEKHQHSRGKTLVYRKTYLSKAAAAGDNSVDRKGGLSQVTAQIVFTGMPSQYKHIEFAFPLPTRVKAKQIEVTGEVWKKFLDVHENLEKISETWRDRREKLRRGEAIPVFFLVDDNGQLDQIGLSMMFKMAGENKTHQMMPPEHLREELIDLPTRMYGRISDKGSFRGRLSFGILEEVGRANLHWPDGKWLILSSPKPSYYPSYIRQRDLRNDHQLHEKAQYRSYMNWKMPGNGAQGGPDRIRGWKRYPIPSAQLNLDDLPGEPSEQNDSASKLFPLAAGATFHGKIRFHNLHPIELGALLWALEWGSDDSCHHSVGMGKPFGWGMSKITVSGLTVNGDGPDKTDYVSQFTRAMDGAVRNWAETPQIKSLKAMARAEHNSEVIAQMDLPGFRNAKKARHVLPEIGFTPDGITRDPPMDRMKRDLTTQEKNVLQERDAKMAESGKAWVKARDIVKVRVEIDGKTYLVKGQVQRDQTSEDMMIPVYLGEKLMVQSFRRSDMTLIK